MAVKGDLIRLEDVPKTSAESVITTIGTSWTGTEAPFTQTFSINNILSTDKIVADIIPSDDYSVVASQMENYGYIYKMIARDNEITCYATEKTTVPIMVQFLVIRS